MSGGIPIVSVALVVAMFVIIGVMIFRRGRGTSPLEMAAYGAAVGVWMLTAGALTWPSPMGLVFAVWGGYILWRSWADWRDHRDERRASRPVAPS